MSVASDTSFARQLVVPKSSSMEHRARNRVSRMLCLLVLASTRLFALDASKAITQYTMVVWNTERGLTQNNVLEVAQTTDGYLWLATQEGVARFDGVRF